MTSKLTLMAVVLLFTGVVNADCFGAKVSEDLFCEKLAETDTAVSINNGAQGVTVSLVKEGKIVSEMDGLGYQVDDFQFDKKKVSYKVFKVADKQNVLALRVKGNTLSLLRFVVISDNELVAKPVVEKYLTKNFIVTKFGDNVSISSTAVELSSPLYKASFQILEDRVELKNYQPK